MCTDTKSLLYILRLIKYCVTAQMICIKTLIEIMKILSSGMFSMAQNCKFI